MPATATQTVMVVDDEENLRGLLQRYLESRGFAVLLAGDGQEAIDLLSRQVPDLVLTDIYMPTRSGKDLVAQISARHPHLPIVAMTGHPKVADAVEMMKAGVCDYLAKPLQLDRLESVIRSALARHEEPVTPPVEMEGAPAVDEIVAGYRLLKAIGRGSMGLVYLARRDDDPDAPEVALKILYPGPGLVHSDVLRRRFLREAETACIVHHPAIVRILQYGIAEPRKIAYMVMEYVQGESLERIIDSDRPLSYREKAELIYQIADGLAAIHACNLCHRDIKPSNVIVDDRLRARLTDFGLVRVPDSDLTGVYKVVGTPAYLAPESYQQAIVDARVDVFALGVTAYELFLGTRPFDSVVFASLVNQIEHELPPEPRRTDPHFPLGLQLILARLLKKNPAERYQTAAEAARDLAAWLAGPSMATRLGDRLRHWRSNDWR